MSKSPALASILALAAVLLGGCDSARLDWTPIEAPKALRVNTAHSVYTVSFAPGSGVLSPSETARLANYIVAGGIQPSDRISLATGSIDPKLAQSRRNHVAAALRQQGVGATIGAASDPVIGGDRIMLAIERSVVTLPNCPDWSKPPVDDTGGVSSNFGCANMTNLGLMVADPADLLGDRATGPGDPATTNAAVDRYRANQAWGAPLSGAPALPSAEAAGSTGTHGSGNGTQ